MGYYDVDKNYDELYPPLTEAQKVLMVWLVKKYTSYTWFLRMHDLIEKFADGYRQRAMKFGTTPVTREVLEGLDWKITCLQKGMHLSKQGRHSEAMETYYEGSNFSSVIEGDNPHNDITHHHYVIGYRDSPKKSVGLYSLAERAIEMSYKPRSVIDGTIKYPNILENAKYPPNILELVEPIVMQGARVYEYEQECREPGIYLPITNGFSAPCYFSKGDVFGVAHVPSLLRRYYAGLIDFSIGKDPIKTRLYHTEIESNYIQVWKEDRYRDGVIPDESFYLDETTELPDEIPATPTLKEEDYF